MAEENIKVENKKSVLSEVQKMKRYLEGCPKVSFMCPLNPGETAGDEIVRMNGHTIQIKKGVLVKMPQPVMEILANKYNIEIKVTERAKNLSKFSESEVAQALS